MLRAALALTLFAVAFGYVEAAVVVYLRRVYEPLRQALFPGLSPADLFPLVPLDKLSPQDLRLLVIELGREAATLLMLAGAGLLAARRRGQWVAGFVIAFGVWDIAFYAFLKLFLDWPASLLTWDLLFLIPVPWVGPVLAPVLVSAVMIACGLLALQRDWDNRPIHATYLHWLGLLGGALIIVLSFTWDYRTLLAGAPPQHFNWPLFSAGLLCGIASFTHAWRANR
ncbi:MAG: hypothetical protein SFV54_20130 [Bryobacteraceae bacterium]|nr:hypothetical protein [Bryobacteraceae bacterium]